MKKEALVNGQMSNILGLLMILNKLQLILPMVTTWVCKLLDKKAEKKILVSSLQIVISILLSKQQEPVNLIMELLQQSLKIKP